MKKFYIKSMILVENLLFELSLFMKLHTFIKKSFFGKNRDPCDSVKIVESIL